MTLMIDLTIEEAEALQQASLRWGLTPDAYAKRLLVGDLPCKPSSSQSLWSTSTPKEWEQHVEVWIKGNQGLPVLSDYAISRDSMYEGQE